MSNELEDIFRLIGDNGYHDNKGARVDCANCEAIDKAKAKLNLLISKREIEARIDEVKKVWGNAREHTITDIEMIMHHTKGKVDFIEAVDTKHLENRLTQLTELQEGKE